MMSAVLGMCSLSVARNRETPSAFLYAQWLRSVIDLSLVSRYLHFVRVIEQQVTLLVLNGNGLIKCKADGLRLVGDGVDVEVAVIRNTEDVFTAEVNDTTVREVIGTVGLAVCNVDGLINRGADVGFISV